MSRPNANHRRILLVEDDLDQAHLVKFLLEAGGKYVVTLAQDGLKGTKLVREGRWDLVITDLNLPGADGMEVLVTAKTHHPEVPVLATTGYSGPQYADEALRKGATDVLIKPLEKDDLLAKVEALVHADAPTDGAASPVAAPATATTAPSSAPPPASPAPAASPAVREAEALAALGAEAATVRPDRREAGEPLRVLAIGVRPGDAEAGCGGTLLRHRKRGDRVVLLTLTHGSAGDEGLARREQAKAAGRALGVRFFVGSAGSGEGELLEDAKRLLKGALAEIRPDLVYLPTAHHGDPNVRAVHDAVANDPAGMYAVYAYDPGDAAPEFRPAAFVRVGTSLTEKLQVLGGFDAGLAPHLAPARSEVGARYWARFGGGEPAEPFEVVRGEAPPWLGDVSLLPPDDPTLG